MSTTSEGKDLSEQQPLYEKYVNSAVAAPFDVLGMNGQLRARRAAS